MIQRKALGQRFVETSLIKAIPVNNENWKRLYEPF